MKIVAMILVIFAFTHSFIQAQNLICPPNDTCMDWESKSDTTSLSFYNGISAIIHYRVKKCNGIVRYYVDSATALDNGSNLDSFNIYHHEYSTLSSLIDLAMMNKVATHFDTTIQNCNVDTTLIVQFYKASCGVWVKCSYKVDTASVVCDVGWDRPKPHYSLNEHLWVDYLRWHPCGQTCCEKTYSVCVDANFTNERIVAKVTQVSTNRHTNTPNCSLQGVFRNGRDTSIRINCQDGC